MSRLRPSVGIEDFGEFRKNDFYYVDKTGMIKDLLENWGMVNLFTRPRRFGKSLNMSMLKYFFNPVKRIHQFGVAFWKKEVCVQIAAK